MEENGWSCLSPSIVDIKWRKFLPQLLRAFGPVLHSFLWPNRGSRGPTIKCDETFWSDADAIEPPARQLQHEAGTPRSNVVRRARKGNQRRRFNQVGWQHSNWIEFGPYYDHIINQVQDYLV